MRDVLPEVANWSQRGDRVALATVIDTQRSAPRPPGVKMAINDHGELIGAVSGGCVENAVVLGAQTAEETALSILAEVVAARHGREGGRLAHSEGRIHKVPA